MNKELRKVNVTLAFKRITKESAIESKLIGWWTNGKYSHSEIIIDNYWISSRMKDGVHVKKLKKLKNTYDYLELPSVYMTEIEYINLFKWIRVQEHKEYDKMGIVFSQFLPFRLDSRDKWFCSEIDTKILQILRYYYIMDKLPHTVDPVLLHKLTKEYLNSIKTKG